MIAIQWTRSTIAFFCDQKKSETSEWDFEAKHQVGLLGDARVGKSNLWQKVYQSSRGFKQRKLQGKQQSHSLLTAKKLWWPESLPVGTRMQDKKVVVTEKFDFESWGKWKETSNLGLVGSSALPYNDPITRLFNSVILYKYKIFDWDLVGGILSEVTEKHSLQNRDKSILHSFGNFFSGFDFRTGHGTAQTKDFSSSEHFSVGNLAEEILFVIMEKLENEYEFI